MKVPHFNSIEEINSSYRTLWKEYRKKSGLDGARKYLERWPIQYDTNIKSQSLLFVGFNPSYDDGNKPLQLTDDAVLDDKLEIKKAIEDERTAQRGNAENKKERYSYYSVFPDISEAIGFGKEDWNHIDLLPFRQRAQGDLIGDFQLNTSISEWFNGYTTEKELIRDCVGIFLGFIEYLIPKVVVVVNGFFSKLIIQHTGSNYLNNFKNSKVNDHDAKDVFSFYLLGSPNKNHRFLRIENKYPLLLSSMLTGQRALDLGSRERLIWNIEQVLRMIA